MTNWFPYDKIKMKIIKYLIGFDKMLIKTNLTIQKLSEYIVMSVEKGYYKYNNCLLDNKK